MRLDEILDSDLLAFVAEIENLDSPVQERLEKIDGSVAGDADVGFLDGLLKLRVDAALEGSLAILQSTRGAIAVLDGEAHRPHRGYGFGVLTLAGSVGVDAAGQGSVGPFSIGLSARARAAFAYRHVLEADRRAIRKDLLEALARRSTTPNGLDLRSLGDPGRPLLKPLAGNPPRRLHELHEWEIELGFELGAEIGAGWKTAVSASLFNDAGDELQAQFRAGFQAAFGLGRWQRTRLTVGTLGVAEDVTNADSWVRIRASRAERRELGIGVHFTLQMKYDGSGLEKVLDHVLETSGFDRLRAALQGAADKRSEGGGAGSVPQPPASLDALLGALKEEWAEDLLEFIDPDQALDPQTRLEDYLDADRAVRAWLDRIDELDPHLQALLEGSLGYARLRAGAPLRQAIERLADIAADPDRDLLAVIASPDGLEAQELVEVLSGVSLEEILTLQDPSGALAGLRSAAAQLTDVLGSIDRTLLDRVDAFIRRTGVRRAVEQISAVAGAPPGGDPLSGLPGWVRKVARKVAGGDVVATEQLASLRAWAKEVAELLADAKEVEKKLRKALAELNGSVGFSLAIELERLTRSEALIDLALDTDNAKCRTAFSELAKGRLDDFLAGLPEPERDDEESPFRILEGIFTSQRSATRTVSLLAGSWSRSKVWRKRVAEHAIRIDTARTRRVAAYAGGFLEGVSREAGPERSAAMNSGVWIQATVQGAGLEVHDAYDREPKFGMLITFVRSDEAMTAEELRATLRLLADMGFLMTDPVTLPAGVRVASRLALRLSLPASAVAALIGTEREVPGMWDAGGWDTDFLNAASRWFDEPLVGRPSPYGDPRIQWGRILAGVVESRQFREEWWPLGSQPFLESTQNGFPVRIPKPDGSGEILAVVSQEQHRNPLASVIYQAGNASRRLRRASQARSLARRHKLPAQFDDLSWKAAKALRSASARFWPNPTFAPWLILARLDRLHPQALEGTRGVAVFRTRHEDDWQSPTVLRLDSLRVPRGPHPFPFTLEEA